MAQSPRYTTREVYNGMSTRPRSVFASKSVGHVRLDQWEERLVRVLKKVVNENGDFLVEDLLTEETYTTPLHNINGNSYSEMEVVAFITASKKCDCCGREGGKGYKTTQEEDTPHVCGGCYRAACDLRVDGSGCIRSAL